MPASLASAKLILIRLTGVFAIAIGLLGVFLVVNPATTHRLSRYALVYDAIAFVIWVGLGFLRQWAAAIFSPVPMKRVGIFSPSWIATTIPPLPLPSSLATIKPVSPSA